MTLKFKPSIQKEVDAIIKYMHLHKKAPINDYVDREILLTFAALSLNDPSLQWSVQSDVLRPFTLSSSQPYYMSFAYMEKQLKILEDVDNLQEIIDAIYSSSDKLPKVTLEQTNLLWLSGFIKYQKFIGPNIPNSASAQALMNFISFVDEQYDTLKTYCGEGSASLIAIEDFETEILRYAPQYLRNSELFKLMGSKLEPDTYPIEQNINIILNAYIHALSMSMDPFDLIRDVFSRSPIMLEVLRPLRTMVDLGFKPFDYHDTKLIRQAFESLQIVSPENLPDQCI